MMSALGYPSLTKLTGIFSTAGPNAAMQRSMDLYTAGTVPAPATAPIKTGATVTATDPNSHIPPPSIAPHLHRLCTITAVTTKTTTSTSPPPTETLLTPCQSPPPPPAM
nr:unnamed protein product [Spirometra erinaceieuropaei]